MESQRRLIGPGVAGAPRIYESALSPEELKALRSILELPEIKEAHFETPMKKRILEGHPIVGGAYMKLDIARNNRLQHMEITDTEQEAYSKPLKPLFAWVDAMLKRKNGLTKEKQVTICAPAGQQQPTEKPPK